MSTLVVLSPPDWLVEDLRPGQQPEPGWIPMDPVFHRDGLYGDRRRKRVWLEWQGHAWWGRYHWKYLQNQIRWHLSPRYTEKELAAFDLLWRYLPPKVLDNVTSCKQRMLLERKMR